MSRLSTVLNPPRASSKEENPKEGLFGCFPKLPLELRLMIWRFHFAHNYRRLVVLHPTYHPMLDSPLFQAPQGISITPYVSSDGSVIPPVSCTMLDPDTNLICERWKMLPLISHEARDAALEYRRTCDVVSMAWDVLWATGMDHQWHPTNAAYVLDRTGPLRDKNNILGDIRRRWDPIEVNWESDLICTFHRKSSSVHALPSMPWASKIQRLALSDSFDYWSGLVDMLRPLSGLREVFIVYCVGRSVDEMVLLAKNTWIKELPRDELGFVSAEDVLSTCSDNNCCERCSHNCGICKILTAYAQSPIPRIDRAIRELGSHIKIKKVVDVDGKTTENGRGYWRRWDDPAESFTLYDSFAYVERYL